MAKAKCLVYGCVNEAHVNFPCPSCERMLRNGYGNDGSNWVAKLQCKHDDLCRAVRELASGTDEI